jgi:AcrR family transcriptional regulator
MPSSDPAPSRRKLELLEAAYDYVLSNGLGELSLRPLASAVGSSPRVLLYLFESKDGLIRALLQRARVDELTMLDTLHSGAAVPDLAGVGNLVWDWFVDPSHHDLLVLWAQAYARSLAEPAGPWADFARQTVDDWLGVFARYQPARFRRSAAGRSERTAVLSLLRGALLDLLATGDAARITQAVRGELAALNSRHS